VGTLPTRFLKQSQSQARVALTDIRVPLQNAT